MAESAVMTMAVPPELVPRTRPRHVGGCGGRAPRGGVAVAALLAALAALSPVAASRERQSSRGAAPSPLGASRVLGALGALGVRGGGVGSGGGGGPDLGSVGARARERPAVGEAEASCAPWCAAPPAVRARGGAAAGGRFMQLIDDAGAFSNASLSRYLATSGMRRDASYSVVSVLGPQSSGKSTLLNALFGTSFDVMDAARGRSQTTKGVWLARAQGRDVLLLDLQGTDSREGGEESKTFERQSALFALAVSDTLVVNVWVHDLGRYNAANLALLRTVVEMHLRLFGAGKRRLLFIVRDHVRSVTPLSALEQMVRSDVQTIWDEVPKPEGMAGRAFEELFDVQVTSLPHYELERERWQAELGALREAVVGGGPPGGKPAVPADGFEAYTRSVWGTVRSEQDLNLPSQQEMLALFRCGEVADGASAALRNATAPMARALDNGAEPYPALGARLGALLNSSLAKYDKVAALYSKKVAAEKRGELRARALEIAGALLEKQLDAAIRRAEKVHGAALEAAAPSGGGGAPLDLADRLLKAEAAAASAYQQVARDAPPPGCAAELAHVFAAGEQRLRQRLSRLDARARREAADCVLEEARAALAERVEPRAVALLKETPVDVWARLARLRAAALANATRELDADLAALRVEGKALDGARAALEKASRAAIVGAARSAALHVQEKMRRRFETAFKFDEHNLPRVWQRGDDINAECQAAQDAARKLLELLAVVPADGKFEQVTLVDEGTKVGLLQNLILEARTQYLSAKQAQDALVTKPRAPFWMMGLLGLVLAREALNFMPKFLVPSFLVQGLSLAAFSALGLLVVAKVMGPRVLLGTLALASPPAAQKVEWLLRTAGLMAPAEPERPAVPPAGAGPGSAVRRSKVVASKLGARRGASGAGAARPAAAGIDADYGEDMDGE